MMFLWVVAYLFVGFLLAALIKRIWGVSSGLMLFCCIVGMPVYLLIVIWCLVSGSGAPVPFLYHKEVK